MTDYIKVYSGTPLWEDLQKLDSLFSELCWDPDDELTFTHDGEKIIISNSKTKY